MFGDCVLVTCMLEFSIFDRQWAAKNWKLWPNISLILDVKYQSAYFQQCAQEHDPQSSDTLLTTAIRTTYIPV